MKSPKPKKSPDRIAQEKRVREIFSFPTKTEIEKQAGLPPTYISRWLGGHSFGPSFGTDMPDKHWESLVNWLRERGVME